MSQEAVRNLFNQETNEFIYESFHCTTGFGTRQGRLFLCEDNFCYYSSIIGIEVKIKIELKQVKFIKLKGESIIIEVYNNNKVHTFSRFGKNKERYIKYYYLFCKIFTLKLKYFIKYFFSVFSMMLSIHQGEYFGNTGNDLKSQNTI